MYPAQKEVINEFLHASDNMAMPLRNGTIEWILHWKIVHLSGINLFVYGCGDLQTI